MKTEKFDLAKSLDSKINETNYRLIMLNELLKSVRTELSVMGTMPSRHGLKESGAKKQLHLSSDAELIKELIRGEITKAEIELNDLKNKFEAL